MTSSLTEKLVAAYLGPAPGAAARREVVRAFADTLAVIQVGWGEPVSRRIRAAYPEVPLPFAYAGNSLDAEQAALVWGTAAHALDYDDVHTTSISHPSAVLVPAIEAAVRAEGLPRAGVVQAYLMGLSVNVALGEALGLDHYSKGWHETSTIGPLAAAAAVSSLMGLDEAQFRSALSMATAQAGGMQRNFGSMAKPLQAGLAAAAGVRAARLAAAGLTADADPFGPKGFLDLYGGRSPGRPVSEIAVQGDAGTLSRKLFACCYQAHRPIAAALQARGRIELALLADPSVDILVKTPYGSTDPLRVIQPMTGLEAKFSGPYAVAAALLDGEVPLASFTDEAVRRPEVIDLLRRTRLVEDTLDGPAPVGMNHGSVRLQIRRGDSVLATGEAQYFPGSPELPISDAELEAKVADCLAWGKDDGGLRIGTADFLTRAAECAP
jgi:2-methylcitrate dehydratase PrpD